MSLVAYDNSSDESENEEQNSAVIIDTQSNNSIKKEKALKSTTQPTEVSLNNNNNNLSNGVDDPKKDGLFVNLPSPKSNSIHIPLSFVEENLSDKEGNKTLTKKQPVKITIPSLSEFEKEDEEEEVPKKRLKPSEKGTSLFSLLPAPKNILITEIKKNFIPNVLKKKSVPPSSKKAKPLTTEVNSQNKNDKTKPTLKIDSKIEPGEESDDSDTGNGDFFSLANDDEEPSQDTSSSIEDLLAPLPEVIAASKTEEETALSTEPEPILFNEPITSIQDQDTQELSDEAIAHLCGRRGKRLKEPVTIIDVNGDSLLPDSNEWLLKQISEEQDRKRFGRPDEMSREGRGNGGPSSAHKRKHQITYLAFQAKENEIELKNQWAQNRMTRKQTQSKYGF